MQHQQNAPGRARLLESLVELVAARDRRVAEVETGAGQERSAARSAQEEDLARSSSVMTDDGGPAPKE